MDRMDRTVGRFPEHVQYRMTTIHPTSPVLFDVIEPASDPKAVTVDPALPLAIACALDAACGGGGNGNGFVSVLVPIITAYTAPFVSVLTSYPPSAGYHGSLHPFPYRMAGTEWIVLVQTFSHQFVKQSVIDGRVVPFCGIGVPGSDVGTGSTAEFQLPSQICPDPLRTSGDAYYLLDYHSLRYFDVATDSVSVVAGRKERGWVDGVGSAARFDGLTSMCISSDGRVSWVCQADPKRLASIDLSTNTVKSCSSDLLVDTPLVVLWDRNPRLPQSESALFLACTSPDPVQHIVRYDIAEGEISHCYQFTDYCPFRLVSLADGRLLFACAVTYQLHVLDPETNQTQSLVMPPSYCGPEEISVCDEERCVYVCDTSRVFYKFSAPVHWFE